VTAENLSDNSVLPKINLKQPTMIAVYI